MPARPILLTVDDDRAVSRAVARDRRRRYGDAYRVVRAESGADALAVLRELTARGELTALLVLTLRTRADDEAVFVEIADDGPGVAEEVRAPLFEAFVTTKAAGEGERARAGERTADRGAPARRLAQLPDRPGGDDVPRPAAPLVSSWQVSDGGVCPHADGLPAAPGPAEACEDCLRIGGRWVHLRRCLSCGHVGCCDSSPHRHATAHYTATAHPVAASAEPREHWAWCYPDSVLLLPAT